MAATIPDSNTVGRPIVAIKLIQRAKFSEQRQLTLRSQPGITSNRANRTARHMLVSRQSPVRNTFLIKPKTHNVRVRCWPADNRQEFQG